MKKSSLTPAQTQKLEGLKWRVVHDEGIDLASITFEPELHTQFGSSWRVKPKPVTRITIKRNGSTMIYGMDAVVATIQQPPDSQASQERLAEVRAWWAENVTQDFIDQERAEARERRVQKSLDHMGKLQAGLDKLALEISGLSLDGWLEATTLDRDCYRNAAKRVLAWTAAQDDPRRRPSGTVSLDDLHKEFGRPAGN